LFYKVDFLQNSTAKPDNILVSLRRKIWGYRLRFRDKACGKLVGYDFEKLARVNQHGIQGCVLAQNINNGIPRQTILAIFCIAEAVALIILTLKLNPSIGSRNRRTDK